MRRAGDDRMPPRGSARLPLPGWSRAAVVLALCVAALTGLAQTSPGRAALRTIGLIRQTSSFSALYFTDPNHLQVQLPDGAVTLPVNFSVDNVTSQAQGYRWSIELVDGADTEDAASGEVTVQEGGTASVQKQVSGTCWSGQLEVVVRLAAPLESIDFFAECSPAFGK